MDNATLAQMAFFSLDRKTRLEMNPGNDQALPPDLLPMAEMFADRAFSLMHEQGTRDPRTHSRTVAEEAVIRYIKLRLVGDDPTSDREFMAMVNAWSKIAARNDTN